MYYCHGSDREQICLKCALPWPVNIWTRRVIDLTGLRDTVSCHYLGGLTQEVEIHQAQALKFSPCLAAGQAQYCCVTKDRRIIKYLMCKSITMETGSYLQSGKTQNEVEQHKIVVSDNATRLVWSLCKFLLCYPTYYSETSMNRVATENSVQIMIS